VGRGRDRRQERGERRKETGERRQEKGERRRRREGKREEIGRRGGGVGLGQGGEAGGGGGGGKGEVWGLEGLGGCVWRVGWRWWVVLVMSRFMEGRLP
jgi:hypothetical protein